MSLDDLRIEQSPISYRTRNKYKSIREYNTSHPFVSASDLQNFCFDDAFSDVLDLYFSPPEPHPLESLFQKGIDFENNVIQQLREKTGLELPKLSSHKTSRDYSYHDSKRDFSITLQAMNRGDPILYSAYLWDEEKKIHGIPDLLVRNDYLSVLFPNYTNYTNYTHTYYYVPVEIKYSSLHRTTTNFLSNSGRMKYYKTQLMMYNKLLISIQNVFPGFAFIIGKRLVNSDGTVEKNIESPGYINYLTKDSSYVSMTEKAIQWIKTVKQYGMTWNLFDTNTITTYQLYPNMKVVHPYHEKIKKQWASHIDEITQIWRCSPIHRQNAQQNNIWSWKDQRCTASSLGINGEYSKIVDAILLVNRSEEVTYLPKQFGEKEIGEIEKIGNPEDVMYIDFETMYDEENETNRIFMIGVVYQSTYRCFCMNENTMEEEHRIMTDFYNYYNEVNKPIALYWYAESAFWNTACQHHKDANRLENINWIDLYPLWTSCPIVFKGAFNFKLKTLISAMKTLGYTAIELPPEECEDGMKAMKIAERYYTHRDNVIEWLSIQIYNRLDCYYVKELYGFMTKIKDDSMICTGHL